ncbi:hypothetical protein WME99_26040 [Sorangium sp. So ce136]|uniref:hypothetical protein n=1 Tax=Sorangium sp. So ce136 TaxID=3133284 RepID=UPI003F0B7C4D
MNTSISLFFGLMMLQTFGAGCTARVQVGDDSGRGDQEAGPDGATGGVESSAGSGGAGGGFSSTSGSSVAVGSGGFSSTSGSSVAVGVSSVTVGSGGGDSAPTAGAIALFRSEFPGEPSNDSASSSSVGGGTGIDPYDLFIVFGAPVSSCADPTYAHGCDNWQLGISIPPALQVPGIIDLSAPEQWSYYVVNSPDSGGGCSSGEGSFTSGTMEIVSIDAAEVVVRLSGTDTHDFDANGEYTAARCF